MSAEIALSIVVGCIDGARSVERAATSIRASCSGIDAELLLIDASRDDSAERVARACPAFRVERCAPGTLMPQLWARGLALSTGRVVAFTTAQCVVPAGWARALLARIASGAAAVGGPLELAAATRPVDWAVYFLRYSAFLPSRQPARTVHDLPGENAAYPRALLVRHSSSFSTGFWEVDVNRRLRADGGELYADPEAAVQLSRTAPLLGTARHRFAHGRHSGASRIAAGDRTAWQVLLASPLVPAVLAGRVGRRVWRCGRDRARFVLSLPLLLLLAAAWAAGEAWGAVAGAGLPNALSPVPAR